MKDEFECRELNKRKWDSVAERFGGRYGKSNIFLLRWFQKKVLRLIDMPPNGTFLDLGCGVGWAVRSAAGRAPGGKFYGVDISPKMIEVAKKNSEGLANVQFFQTSVESLPFDANYFDVIICTNSFHHFPGPVKALAEARRVLKPEGRIYIADPTADGIVIRFLDLLGRLTEKEHVKQYSTKEYVALFAGAQLTYVATRKLAYPEKVHIGKK